MPDTSDKILLFLFFVLPGLVAIQVYSLKFPPAKRELSSATFEAILYSAINLILWFWWVHPLSTTKWEKLNPVEITFALFIICLISPYLLAMIWHELRTESMHYRMGYDHPIPRGWDFFIRNNNHFFVLFHLKNGKMVGGYFGSRSFASTFPQEPEIYCEKVCRVDDRGEFTEWVEGSLGTVMKVSDCERVEFFCADDKEPQCRNSKSLVLQMYRTSKQRASQLVSWSKDKLATLKAIRVPHKQDDKAASGK